MCFNQEMDFETIIAALAQEFAGEEALQSREEVAELAEAELVSAGMSDRLRAAEGLEVNVFSPFGVSAKGRIVRSNPAWVLLEDGGVQELVSTTSMAVVEGLARVAPEPSLIDKRLGLSAILRQIMRQRRRVAVQVGATSLTGFIVSVYKDHVDIGYEGGVSSVSLSHLFSIRLLPGF
ncbi:MAG: hypothetical protein E6432_00520 [Actinomyces sp.]|nr:hypothetical protein [Actinomyces sp.]